jgi:membrane dipeptidase
MGGKKKYSGYKSFQYLEAGHDYKEYELCKELGRVEYHEVPLSKVEEERFQEIIENNIVISLHDHPTVSPVDMSLALELKSMGRQFTAYEALSVSGLDCVFDNMMDGTAYITSYSGWKWTDIIHDIGIRFSDIHHQDLIKPCYRVQDVRDAFKNGQIAFVFCLESATPIENELDRIDILYGLGIRSMGICYSASNMLGGGIKDPENGLTDFGYDAIKRMNKLGMLIDRGHANNRTVHEAIEASDKPIYVSHSLPTTVTKQPHNTSDEVLQALAENDGVFALYGGGYGAVTEKHPVGSIEGYGECLEYCIDLMGVDHVGCGPDTMYGDQQGLYVYWFPRPLAHYTRPGTPTLSRLPISEGMVDPGYVMGLENPNEFVNIARWMIRNGYSDDEIVKVIGANAMRLMEHAW